MQVLTMAGSAGTACAALPLCLQEWATQRFRRPTFCQRMAWPIVASGRNLLLSSPSGTGKTLAACLPILGNLLQFPIPTRSVRCLYVAPLKALVNDLHCSLQISLNEIGFFLGENARLPAIATRTGDTPQHDRKSLWDNPPEILLTTPESLSLLLSRAEADELFAELRWVIVDEIHSLAANKRGADLSLSLERLEAIQGRHRPLQRIGLSATSTPLEESARFLVGVGCDCAIARAVQRSPLQLTLAPLASGPGFVRELIAQLGPSLHRHRSVLIFAGTRNLAERLSWALRRRFPQWDKQIAVHHSALAAPRRQDVEQQFKRGHVRVLVCSTSLELGIDVGTVDLVVLVHPPGGVTSLLQRVGRAGHAPGRARRGVVFTGSTAELLEAAVTTAAARIDQLEHLRMPEHPLDVLCQQLLGMAMNGAWTPEDAFQLVRRAAPYANLTRRDFDDCLGYLSGRASWSAPDEDWLPSRLQWMGDRFTILNERTAKVLRRNLGTILTETTADVVLENERGDEQPIGTIDESFAERLQPGDQFLLDGRCLEHRRTEVGGQHRPHSAQVIVREVMGRPRTPRWAGEGPPLSPELAHRLCLLRARAAEALREGAGVLQRLLENEYGLHGQAIVDLIAHFEQQEAISEIPDTAMLLIEAVPNHFGADYYLHTPLNRCGNDALARVAGLRLERHNRAVETTVADLGILLVLRDRGRTLTPEDFRELLSAVRFMDDLHESMRDGLLLRARFQRVAFTGLMLLRNPIGKRRRVGGRNWGERRLFEQVQAAAPDFVLLRQAEREIHVDALDAASALEWARQLPRMTLRNRELSRPSPFAEAWTQALTSTSGAELSAEETLQRFCATMIGEA